MTAKVIIRELARDISDLEEQFYASFAPLGLIAAFQQARGVFIKPNLTYPVYREGVTTRPIFVAALIAALRRINATTVIYIGEGEGGYNSFSMTAAFETMGFYNMEREYPNVVVVNLSDLPTRKVELTVHGRPYPLDLPELFFTGVDFAISCPVPKVHCMTGISLSLKNQWGCLPDMMRLRHHHAFAELIGQVCEALSFRYAFLDGSYGLDGNGPIVGAPVELNWFAAADSLGAFDMVVAKMMGWRWRRIGHLREAEKRGYLPQWNEIDIDGEWQALQRRFVLRRTFWNYPALAAFRSRRLTMFCYFSRWSRLLHDVMYRFRT